MAGKQTRCWADAWEMEEDGDGEDGDEKDEERRKDVEDESGMQKMGRQPKLVRIVEVRNNAKLWKRETMGERKAGKKWSRQARARGEVMGPAVKRTRCTGRAPPGPTHHLFTFEGTRRR